jgi:glycosyltransferase involved in cell wall biosynthesis
MKIAVVTRYFPSSAEPWQGRSAYQTLRRIAGQADVQVFYPNAAYPSWLKPSSRSYDQLDRSYSPPGVRAGYFDYPAVPVLSRPLNGWMAAHVLLPPIRAFAPDLIFSCFLYPDGYAALKIGKALSVPTVAMSIGSDINRIGDRISAAHTRTVLRESDFIVTVSHDLCAKAVAMGARPEKTRAIINGCDLSVFRVQSRTEARQKLGLDAGVAAIVYIGRLDVKKGLRELVEAAVSVHADRPSMHVYLVGEGPDRSVLASAIQAGNAGNYIHLMGACAFDDVATWMAAADLVTLPSYMEGCPNVVLEALACGRPVVATNVGGIPEIMDDACGQLVPPRNAGALSNALAAVLEKEWDAEAVSARGSRSWDAVAAELFAVFESVAAERKARPHAR